MATEDKHFPVLILICFITCFISGIAGNFFPNQPKLATNIWQISNLCYVAGCALLSLKAASENRHISATGFILLSIGLSTLFSLQTSDDASTSNAYISGALICIPGMLFILYYKLFPLWVRIAGLFAILPRIILVWYYYTGIKSIEQNRALDGIGYLLMNIVGIFWAYFIFKNARDTV